MIAKAGGSGENKLFPLIAERFYLLEQDVSPIFQREQLSLTMTFYHRGADAFL